ncbi:MAG: magnesium/cobalt transporter CorA [Pyrinomonadaceae bacterium]|nr:magnesium/cobalt transporter CorA [Phycisphaerales bacterium]
MSELSRTGRRKRSRSRKHPPPGTAPGTLIADPSAPKPIVRVMAFGPAESVEAVVSSVDEIRPYLAKWPVTWVNVDGLGDASLIAALGELFGLHSLALEDVLNTHQRAKVDVFSDHLYIVTREVELSDRLDTDQISMFLGKNYVITFQERTGDCLGAVRERIRKSAVFRSHAPDYLAYALLDAVIDGYFPTLEQLGERIESLEEEVVLNPKDDLVHRIHATKRELLTLRRAIWPARDAINTLLRDPNPLIRDETRLYLRDCHDHVIQVIDMMETYRELGSDLMDIYLSSLSNRLNSVMKVLTMIATIFMPLSFIVGIYGMNFNREHPLNMPELDWKYGYPAVWGVILCTVAGMAYYFWRNGWLRSSRSSENAKGKT